MLLSEKLLKEEIAHLESTRILRVQLTAADNWTDEDKADFAGNRRDSSDLYFQSDRLRLLFKWCKIVCRVYGLKVRTRIHLIMHLKKNHWTSSRQKGERKWINSWVGNIISYLAFTEFSDHCLNLYNFRSRISLSLSQTVVHSATYFIIIILPYSPGHLSKNKQV